MLKIEEELRIRHGEIKLLEKKQADSAQDCSLRGSYSRHHNKVAF